MLKKKKSLLLKVCSLLMAYGAVVMLGFPGSAWFIGEPELPAQLNKKTTVNRI